MKNAGITDGRIGKLDLSGNGAITLNGIKVLFDGRNPFNLIISIDLQGTACAQDVPAVENYITSLTRPRFLSIQPISDGIKESQKKIGKKVKRSKTILNHFAHQIITL